MPAFFPEPLPDELFYSIVARYAALSGLTGGGVRLDLFGHSKYRVTALPTALKPFLARLPPGHPFTFQSLVEEHTTFPYHRPFLPSERVQKVMRLMRYGGRSPGALATGIKNNPGTLRWCGECAISDHVAYGLPYWHRVHQLPGVLVCPKHRCNLTASSTPQWSSSLLIELVPLPEALIRGGVPVEHPGNCAELVHAIAADSEWLLNHKLNSRRRRVLVNRLHGFGASAGWAQRTSQPRARARRNAIAGALVERVGEETLAALGAPLMPRWDGEDWVWLAFRQRGGDPPPLHYIILLQFFGLSISDFFTGTPAPQPPMTRRVVLRGPCGNPLCNRFDPPVPRTLPSSKVGSAIWVRVECPACGFVYSQRALNPLNRRILSCGLLFESRLRALVADSANSLGKIAEELGTTRNTVKRIANKLGLWRSDWLGHERFGRSAVHAAKRQKLRDDFRRRYLALRRDDPSASKSQLALCDPSATEFLRKYDREWLAANAPPYRRSTSWHRVGWASRDDEVLRAARDAVAELRGGPARPTRITLHGIASVLGTSGRMLAMRMAQMPRTREFVEGAVESRVEAARRRLRWAVQQYAEEGTVPFPTNLRRRAGLLRMPQLRDEVHTAVRILEAFVEEGEPLPPEWAC